MAKLKNLIGKRILVALKESYGHRQEVEEFKIREVSPSGKWVKVQNSFGNKFWKVAEDITPIEILDDLEECPKGR